MALTKIRKANKVWKHEFKRKQKQEQKRKLVLQSKLDAKKRRILLQQRRQELQQREAEIQYVKQMEGELLGE